MVYCLRCTVVALPRLFLEIVGRTASTTKPGDRSTRRQERVRGWCDCVCGSLREGLDSERVERKSSMGEFVVGGQREGVGESQAERK